MKKPLHRFIALLPMFALGASAMVYFFFGIAQFQYKVIAERNMDCGQGLSTIRIPLSDFKKQAGNNEVWYDGKLYDISSYSIEKDSACVVIFHDEQEESLIKNIADNFDLNDNYVSDNDVHIVKHRIHIPDDNKIKTIVATLQLDVTATGITNNPLPYFIQYCATAYASILKPPPNLA